jgi:hypothetical protein
VLSLRCHSCTPFRARCPGRAASCRVATVPFTQDFKTACDAYISGDWQKARTYIKQALRSEPEGALPLGRAAERRALALWRRRAPSPLYFT